MRVSLSVLALLASWLCTPQSAWAATRPERGVMARSAEPRTVFGHPARRLGPIAQSMARRAGLGETMALIRCATDAADDDDGDAIQDEAPATPIDTDDAAAPALRPLGTLVSSRHALPAHRILSRRSPRGPPIS